MDMDAYEYLEKERAETQAFWENQGIRFINAYSAQQHYGGPEEGGWWYESGEPVASIPVREIYPETMQVLVEAWTGIVEQALDGAISKLKVYVEFHPAWNYPLYKPHYE